VINARSEAALAALADDIKREMGVSVTAVVADITTEEGRRVELAAAPQPDIFINDAGGRPPGDLRSVGREAWISTVDANMLTSIFLIRENHRYSSRRIPAVDWMRSEPRPVINGNRLPGATTMARGRCSHPAFFTFRDHSYAERWAYCGSLSFTPLGPRGAILYGIAVSATVVRDKEDEYGDHRDR
jgi:hypothetical protein